MQSSAIVSMALAIYIFEAIVVYGVFLEMQEVRRRRTQNE